MAKIMKKTPMVRRIVTRSISRALRDPRINMQVLSCFVAIHRNDDAEKIALITRNHLRNRRASVSDVNPNNQNPIQRRRRRRHSFGPVKIRSRRNSMSDASQRNSIPNEPIRPVEPVPFDEEFMHRLNRIANAGNSDGEDNNAVHKQANDEPMEVDENSEQPENEDIPVKSINNNNAIPMTENGDVNVVSGNLETNSTGQLENINVTNADDILNDVSMESVGNGKTTENIGANDDLVPIDIRAESQARKEHENIEAGNLGLNCEAVVESSLDEAPAWVHKPLPAPFHIRGRRPSAGFKTMNSICEE